VLLFIASQTKNLLDPSTVNQPPQKTHLPTSMNGLILGSLDVLLGVCDQLREILKSMCLFNKGTRFQTKDGISVGTLRVTYYDS